MQQPFHRQFHPFISKSSCKEFGASIRFISRRKSPRKHNDLCLINGFFEAGYRFSNIGCIPIFENLNIRDSPSLFKSGCRIIFTVGSGKDRNKHSGLCHLVLANIDFIRVKDLGLYFFCSDGGCCRKNFFQFRGPGCNCLFHGDTTLPEHKVGLCGEFCHLSCSLYLQNRRNG